MPTPVQSEAAFDGHDLGTDVSSRLECAPPLRPVHHEPLQRRAVTACSATPASQCGLSPSHQQIDRGNGVHAARSTAYQPTRARPRRTAGSQSRPGHHRRAQSAQLTVAWVCYQRCETLQDASTRRSARSKPTADSPTRSHGWSMHPSLPTAVTTATQAASSPPKSWSTDAVHVDRRGSDIPPVSQ